ncbi:MAG: M14 family metallopeptidase, partial [Ignavibacteria bacterium]|nr:M14 family metallopeptidase [Ignavibacteria bacterium]
MKKSVLLAILALIVLSMNVYSQYDNVQEKYSQVRINFTSDFDIQRMAAAGLFLDHGSRKENSFETWLSESEIAMLKNSGVPFQILIDDWMTYYTTAMRKGVYVNNNVSLTDAYDITHSIYGTMGGHLKWEEAIAKLDSMRLQYPNLISVKFTYGNSYENRPLWTVRVTKNPDAPTGRPEIWLNGVTHAREPMGMMNIYYYLYWLFENYNIDPVATYILNNREIYFTPFINPDGYKYNQTTNPNGGGMWRKNRQPYSSSIGTDPNRNFGTYNFWNSTNGGSSTSPSSDTYRGPYPFSTPEDSCWKVFVNSRNFKTSLDYHTHGNLLIKPYAWCDPTPTPDDAIFNEMGAECTVQNHYNFGTPYQTVNYYVRGGDLDWMYSTD